jgi:hypothetical protein
MTPITGSATIFAPGVADSPSGRESGPGCGDEPGVAPAPEDLG